jgi:hypothetical protein
VRIVRESTETLEQFLKDAMEEHYLIHGVKFGLTGTDRNGVVATERQGFKVVRQGARWNLIDQGDKHVTFMFSHEKSKKVHEDDDSVAFRLRDGEILQLTYDET